MPRWLICGSWLGARLASASTSTTAALGSLAICVRCAAAAPKSLSGLTREVSPAGFAVIDAKSGYLDQLCVAPAERGSGLASALIDEAKRRSPAVIELDVNEMNPRAGRFYEREGFSVVGRGFNPQSGLPTLKMRWRATG